MELAETAIDELEAGRELDSYIAEHLFNYVWVEFDNGDGMAMLLPPDRAGVWLEKERGKVVQRGHNRFSDWDSYVPKFSTTWEGAGLVWEALPHEKRIHEYKAGEVGVMCLGHSYGASSSFEHVVSATAETLPLAICRAALKVKLLA